MTDGGENNTLDCWEGLRNGPNFRVALTVNVPEIPAPQVSATGLKFDMTEFFDFQTFRSEVHSRPLYRPTKETVTF